ncbi:MAG TPA: hypothetical protein VFT55_10025 [Planctomycetota bacterium]|nr:hypothetical protein [Planctomycetota bacterium]
MMLAPAQPDTPLAAKAAPEFFMLHKYFLPALFVVAGTVLARPAAPQ